MLSFSKVQEPVLPDELEDRGRIRDQEGVLRVLFEDEAESLLGLCRRRCLLYLFFGRLFDLRLVEQHEILNLSLHIQLFICCRSKALLLNLRQ